MGQYTQNYSTNNACYQKNNYRSQVYKSSQNYNNNKAKRVIDNVAYGVGPGVQVNKDDVQSESFNSSKEQYDQLNNLMQHFQMNGGGTKFDST